MVEKVETGGMMSFRHSSENLKLDDERKGNIAKGYAEYKERRRIERRNIIIYWIIALIILLGLGYFLIN